MSNLRPIDEYLIAAIKRAGVKIDGSSPIPRGDSLGPDVYEWLSNRKREYSERNSRRLAQFGDSQEQEQNDEDEDEDDDENKDEHDYRNWARLSREISEFEFREEGDEGGYRGRIRLGDSPKPYDDVEARHPDRPKEPVMWVTAPCAFGWNQHPTVYLNRNWVIKESFVVECFEGRLECEGDPADILTGMLKYVFFFRKHPII